MPPDLPLLKSRTESIARAARGDPLTLTQIRAKLADEGHVLGTEEWSEVKGEIKAVAERVLVSGGCSRGARAGRAGADGWAM